MVLAPCVTLCLALGSLMTLQHPAVTSARSGFISKVERVRCEDIKVLTPEGQTTTTGEHLLLKRLKEHTRKLLAENRPFKCQQYHSILHRLANSSIFFPPPSSSCSHLTLHHPSTWSSPSLSCLQHALLRTLAMGGQTGNGEWAHLNPLPPLSTQVQASPQPMHSAQHSPGLFLL